jgi:hypothetical protein
MKSISSNYSTDKAFKLIFKVYTFSDRAHYKQKISKINFTAFRAELRNKILRIDEAYDDLSSEHLVGCLD